MTQISAAEDRLRIATRAARIGVWEWDLETNAMTYSDIAREICGFSAIGPVTFEMVLAVTHPDDLPNTRAASQRALDPLLRENVVYNYRIRRADTGEERRVIAYGEAGFAEVEGEFRATRYIGTLQDVTDQWRAERQVEESAQRLRLAIDAAEMAVWEIDVQTNTLLGSPELNRIGGFPPDAQPTIEEFNARYAPGELERVKAESERTLAGGDNRIQSEFRYFWPDGRERWLLLRAQVFSDTDGKYERLLGVLMDITERKVLELELELIAGELRHRMKNSLTVVGALARRAITTSGAAPSAVDDFMNRLSAIARATDLMFSKSSDNTPLIDIVTQAISPFRSENDRRFIVTGGHVTVAGDQISKIALALHELGTNALKYGALSSDTGRVRISWGTAADGVRISWVEEGGPKVERPSRTGFGTQLLERGLISRPGSVSLNFCPTGLHCDIYLPRSESSQNEA